MKARQTVLWIALLRLSAFGQTFDVSGRIQPPSAASVSLHGTDTPFAASTLAAADGRFRFSKIERGSYTVVAFVPGRGETRITVDIGPGTVKAKGRVEVLVQLDESRLTPDTRAKVSVRELSIPDKARAEHSAAEKCLARKDVDCAVARLRKAVEIAPQYSAAWNHLGTIAYKTRRYEDAAEYFRKSLAADPEAYEPLVNLGGVLLNLGQAAEAWNYNVHAVLRRPADALANSQLGMTYFEMGKADLALKYLNEARRLDPGHFSLPQLLAAEIHLRRKQNVEAAAVLEEFLRYHPDWHAAEAMRKTIAELRRDK